MSKGENIFKRRDERWEARYIKGRDPAGKIKYGFCYGKTYREAKEKVTKAKADVLTGMPDPTTKRKYFSYYCDAWLRSRKIKIKTSTYVKYETILQKHIKPKFGGYIPSGISNEAIDNFSTELLTDKGLSSKTVHDILVLLHSILKYTASAYSGFVPQIEINYPKISRTEIRVLTMEEQDRFISFLMQDMDPCKFGVLLALLTGIRIGELCALRWSDITLEDRCIWVHATVQRIRVPNSDVHPKTKVILSSPKSEASSRTIPLTAFALELCKAMNPHNAGAYILTGSEKLMEPRTLQYRISTYTHACGLDDVHCHTLRHTFATRAVEVGFEIKSLSEILGHANTAITLNRYVHASMELKRNNMDKLSAIGF